MSGVPTGMAATAAILRPILLALPVGLTAWVVAVAGSTLPGAVARRIVTSLRPTAATAALASALLSPSNNLPVLFVCEHPTHS